MARISDYFTEDKVTLAKYGITLYNFDDTKTVDFVRDCVVPYRDAYMSEQKIDSIVNKGARSRQDVIASRLPRKGKVMSGDFGEILTYYLVTESIYPTTLIQPMKWRLKDKKDAASPYTDVVLLYANDINNPSPNDILRTFEAKTHAGIISGKYTTHKYPACRTYKDGKDKCSFVDAVFDANVDNVSRSAETIAYLYTRYEDTDDDERLAVVARFCMPYTKIPYKKEHKAIAIIEKTDLHNQLNRLPADLLTTYPNITLYCIPIQDLQVVYKSVYNQIPNT